MRDDESATTDDVLRDRLFRAVRRVLDLLVAQDYLQLVRLAGGDRFSEKHVNDLDRVVREYGRTLVTPPDDAVRHMNVIQVELPGPSRWAADMPLWTEEEGMSDLEVRLTLIERDGGIAIQLDDLLVP